jgi:hypothetical protein
MAEIKLTNEQIEKAAEMMKIISLAGQPGMDEIAIKLNCGPTYNEKEYAKRWARAFELATADGTPWESAIALAREFRL